jgi:peptide methionine sulfoxide reductase MsrA
LATVQFKQKEKMTRKIISKHWAISDIIRTDRQFFEYQNNGLVYTVALFNSREKARLVLKALKKANKATIKARVEEVNMIVESVLKQEDNNVK